MAAPADIDFYIDPVCPFCWMTSKWVRRVRAQRGFTIAWKFISLRLLNADVDYAAQFPPDYEAGHTAGLRLLRVCARTRTEHGEEALDRLYEALGQAIFDQPPDRAPDRPQRGEPAFVAPVLDAAGLPDTLLGALDDTALDATIQAETDQALALTGADVGTPILQFRPPEGLAFFGPVISRMPSDEQALVLWDHVVGLASFPGFAELKRSLRERPQLASYGVTEDEVGAREDWQGGSVSR